MQKKPGSEAARKGHKPWGAPTTAGPGGLAGGGKATRAGEGRGWSVGGALSGRDRISTSGRGMAVGGASNTPCVGGARSDMKPTLCGFCLYSSGAFWEHP